MTTTTTRTAQELASAGEAALTRGAWAEARSLFEQSLAAEETARAHDGLAWSAWYVADEQTTLTAREAAYRLYRAAGDDAEAGRVAAWLGADVSEFRGEDAVGRGWLGRAHRLLDPLPLEPAHGWLALIDGSFAMNAGDTRAALTYGAAAAHLGREHGVPDLEAVGLAQEGLALVAMGRVTEGTRRLDEAAAIAAGERFELAVSPAWAICCLLTACDGMGDFPRAEQWSQGMRAWSQRWGARQVLGVCRTAYGRLLATRGAWEEAETELATAIDDLEVARPGMGGGGHVRLAELRARQGRPDEARALLEQADGHPLALVTLGELELEDGEPAAAVDAAERALRRIGRTNVLRRFPALDLLVRAHAAAGAPEAAAEAEAELATAAASLGTPYLRGRASLAGSLLLFARGDHDGARRKAEDAVDLLGESAAPYDAALARLAMARALHAAGRHDRAAAEARAAAGTFASLGAVRDEQTAAALVQDPGPAAAAPDLGELTSRELEVLRLVAQGLSDGEVAERLVVSPHTVHRHVANIRTKLRLPSRAAAVAHASRAGLL